MQALLLPAPPGGCEPERIHAWTLLPRVLRAAGSWASLVQSLCSKLQQSPGTVHCRVALPAVHATVDGQGLSSSQGESGSGQGLHGTWSAGRGRQPCGSLVSPFLPLPSWASVSPSVRRLWDHMQSKAPGGGGEQCVRWVHWLHDWGHLLPTRHPRPPSPGSTLRPSLQAAGAVRLLPSALLIRIWAMRPFNLGGKATSSLVLLRRRALPRPGGRGDEEAVPPSLPGRSLQTEVLVGPEGLPIGEREAPGPSRIAVCEMGSLHGQREVPMLSPSQM